MWHFAGIHTYVYVISHPFGILIKDSHFTGKETDSEEVDELD